MFLPMIALQLLQLLWLRPAVGVSERGAPCRPATQCLAARTAERRCTLPDGSAGLRCRPAGARQERRLGLRTLLQPLTTETPDRHLQLAPGADQRLAHQAGVNTMERLRQASERLQLTSSQTTGNGPSQLAIWNSPSSQHAQQMGYDALQHIETMKQMHVNGRRGQRHRRQTDYSRPTPSLLSSWNSPYSEEAQKKGMNALRALLVMLGRRQDTSQLTRVRTRRQAEHLIPGCTPEPEPRCDPGHRYRSASGQCNNLQKPLWGSALTQQSRLLASTYQDGVFEPRQLGDDGQPLPNVRAISQRTMDSKTAETSDHTLSIMQWGQFLDHDCTLVPTFRLDSGSAIECCEANGGRLPSEPRHPLCIPIAIPPNDPFYSRFGQRCMNMVRSLPAPEPDCIARPASQLNGPSHFLDCSNVYGSSEEQTAELRSFRGGQLRTSTGYMLPVKDAPPAGRSLTGGCPHAAHFRIARMVGEPPNGRCRGEVCFRAGDERVNEQTGLTVVHTTFVRLHNHIATELQRVHRHWDDERLFQESRRIVEGQMQHITYNEWLPAVIGKEYADKHGLLPLLRGYSTLYSPEIDPRITSEFSSAAFRFGHSMVRDELTLIGTDGHIKQTINLTSTFFEPSDVKRWGMADFARMLTNMRSMRFDTSVVKAVHERLFNADQEHGLDLISLNLQRGREHGIPNYSSMLSACTGRTISEFADLLPVMEQKDITRLMKVYRSVDEIDLFLGGLAERAADEAMVGPTFRCIIAQQFFGLRYGDRFFYDNGGMLHSFTPRQLEELRKASWAGVLCDTLGAKYGDDFERVQPLAFIMPSEKNLLESCRSAAISRVDLSVF